MQKTTMAFAVVAGNLMLPTTTRADTITLQVALDRASRRPSIEIAELDVDAARAVARGATVPLYNPELSAGAGPQFGAGSPEVQIQVALSQTIERGGKREARTQLADAQVRGAAITKSGELLRARIEAWQAFEHALIMRDRLETRREVERLALALVESMQKAAQAGGSTRLRVNLVVADAGRATQERIAAETAYGTALAQLATAIGAGPKEQLDPVGAVPELASLSQTPDELVTLALRGNPDVLAAQSSSLVARARIADADARGTVDLTLGIAYDYAPDPSGAHALLGTFSFPLAFRNRNQGERAATRVGAKRAEIELSLVRTETEREVLTAVANYQRSRTAVSGFDREVTDKLNENLAAAQDAFIKGGLELVELTTTQRNLIESRLAYFDARLALVDAWATLALITTMEVAP